MNFTAIVEIPKNGIYKYEFCNETKQLVLDRPLIIPCPFNYGFLENLPIQADGDPLDVFIISADSITPLTQVKLRVWGILLCEDQGVEDNKVIAQIEGDSFRDWDYFAKIKLYLETYKEGFIIKEYKIFNDDLLFRNFVEGK